MIIYILLFATIVCSAIMDAIMSNNAFAKYGLWFSIDGWKVKYQLTEWFNKFLPLWLSKFLAQDIFVIFTDLFHTAKTIMVACFLIAIFGFTLKAFIAWLIWGLLFSFVYAVIR